MSEKLFAFLSKLWPKNLTKFYADYSMLRVLKFSSTDIIK